MQKIKEVLKRHINIIYDDIHSKVDAELNTVKPVPLNTQEQISALMRCQQVVGNITGKITDFIGNVLSSNFSDSELERQVTSKLNAFNEKIKDRAILALAHQRDELEIEIVNNGGAEATSFQKATYGIVSNAKNILNRDKDALFQVVDVFAQNKQAEAQKQLAKTAKN